MVVVSTLTFIISTLEDFKEEMSQEEPDEWTLIFNMILEYIDCVVIIFFTVEYVVRLACAPRKIKFIKNAMNLVDLLALIPFYLALALSHLEDVQIIGKTGKNTTKIDNFLKGLFCLELLFSRKVFLDCLYSIKLIKSIVYFSGKIVRLIRVMRILRIFKLVRHFAGLQSLLFTLRQAYKELGLLMLLVAVAILTFSSLVYFAEKEGYDEETATEANHWTFVESFWWGLMTITTVGYDLDPKTFLGMYFTVHKRSKTCG